MIANFSLQSPCKLAQALETATRYLEESDLFFGHGTDNAWDESVALLLWAMGYEEDPGDSALEELIDPESLEKFVAAINLRADKRLPAAYITGFAWFCGLRFHVDKRVLVPRSPIAELIRNDYRPWVTNKPERILDLCCGSGCIGIAAAVHAPDAKVVLADLSPDALEVARTNVDQFGLNDRVCISQSDLFTALRNQPPFDLILSNPPYVDAEDLASMPPEYRQEPAMALGSGEDGLDLARQILREASQYLTPEGSLVLEVGNSWENLESAFPRYPFTWVSFADGGEGVCVFSRNELLSGNF